jgi:regulator of extracellular matrix RemA (YlzA/DUF370 family)
MIQMLYTLGAPIVARNSPLDGLKVRISENARRSVVFFGAPSPKTGQIEFGGTGFLVTYKQDNFGFGYLVTARHVAARVTPDSGVIVRVNNKQGASDGFIMDDVTWYCHPDKSVDVAVTPCYITETNHDIAYYDLLSAVRRDQSAYRVQCGDPTCIVGLFHLHSGDERNTPIVHSGNVALLPDPNERIPVRDRTTGEILKMEAYLVEAQTLEGLSGAPVYQRETVTMKGLLDEHNGGYPIITTGAQLLGVYSGAWEGDPTPVAQDRRWAVDKRVPVGMGIVVPAERILELVMDHPDLKADRADTLRKRDEARAAKTDSSLPDPPANGANPTHQEDFTRLVSAAARKPAPKD